MRLSYRAYNSPLPRNGSKVERKMEVGGEMGVSNTGKKRREERERKKRRLFRAAQFLRPWKRMEDIENRFELTAIQKSGFEGIQSFFWRRKRKRKKRKKRGVETRKSFFKSEICIPICIPPRVRRLSDNEKGLERNWGGKKIEGGKPEQLKRRA